METKNRNNQKETGKTVSLWKYAAGVLLVLASLGVWFASQSETEEAPAEPQRIVMDERPKQENKKEIAVLKTEPEEQEPAVLPRTKKKAVKSVQKEEIPEELVAETMVAEDTVTDTINDVSVVYRGGSVMNCGGLFGGWPPLNISTGSDNALEAPENNRSPEVLLKDVEALTRNMELTYIVDGIPVSEETFRSLNQNDIESIDIYRHTDMYTARSGAKENLNKRTLRNR